MEQVQTIPISAVHEIRDTCLCFAAQRAARGLARRFDRVFQPLGLTNGQFSMLVILAGRGALRLGRLADVMAMDQTTVTAAVKALEARGILARRADPEDSRARLVELTAAGHALVDQAVPVWRAEIAAIREEFGPTRAQDLMGLLRQIAPPVSPPPVPPQAAGARVDAV